VVHYATMIGVHRFSRDNPSVTPHSAGMRRVLPLLLLVVLAVAGFALLRGVGWDTLARYQATLRDWVTTNPWTAGAAYLVAYTAAVAISLPNAGILTVAGGLLFGKFLGCALTVTGATAGAAILMLIVHSAFVQTVGRHRARIPETVRERLASDGFNYLLALRLVPLFPFWLVNLAAAVVGMRLAVFLPATLIGIAPASFILSSIGAGVGTILAEGKTPDLSILFSARILLPLAGLAVLSLLPAIFRRRKGAHA
jgi:uncharacterized membrane protein YdjX (TVP38/TMEM64 family)